MTLINELHLLLAELEQHKRAAIKAGAAARAVRIEETQQSLATWIVFEEELAETSE